MVLLDNDSMDLLLNQSFLCVVEMCKQHNIDESHALKHSLDVFSFAQHLCIPEVSHQLRVIYVASIVHDMCDRKYMDEDIGTVAIRKYLVHFMTSDELDAVILIITNVSYSKVKKKGFPVLGEWQQAYHIVREADLLASYDIDRCIIFGMLKEHLGYTSAVERAKQLYGVRVLNYIQDGMFITEKGLTKAKELHMKYN
jgi:hypothetical protein